MVDRYRRLGRVWQVLIAAATAITTLGGALAVVREGADWIHDVVDPPPPVKTVVEVNPPGTGIPAREPVVRTDRASVELVRDPKIFDRGLPDWTGYSYVIPRKAAEVPPPPHGLCRDRARWAYGLRGADAGYTRVQATLIGNSEGTVLIDAIDATIEKQSSPLSGTWAKCPVGGGTGEPRRIQVYLDENPPVAQYLDPGGDPAASPVVFTLKKNEPEAFFIDAFAERCYCEWRVNFRLVADGKRRVVTIPPPGSPPFRTTGTRDAKPFIWRGGRWQPTTRN